MRMIAMAIDERFQKAVEAVCTNRRGAFRKTAIKGFARMKNKCISRNDHYHEPYPRPANNIDINRNCSTFKVPDDLVSFIRDMEAHPQFGGRPLRSKNMFLFSQERAEKQFHYRTVMLNWLFTPGMTYSELAASAKLTWNRYLNYTHAPGFGARDASESWSSWRAQIQTALAYLTSPKIANSPVHFIVETQLLLSEYLKGRTKMHLLYKVCRADNPLALCKDFRSDPCDEDRSYDDVQNDALNEMEQARDACETEKFYQHTGADLGAFDMNYQHPDKKGATRLWEASEKGHVKAVLEILKHPGIDVNKVRLESRTTPLFIAASRGHDEVVEALLGHPNIKVNQGALDSVISPLCMAAQEGREGTVEIMLRHKDIAVNHNDGTGATPLCKAVLVGNEHIVALLLAAKDIDIWHELPNGQTAMLIAKQSGREKILGMLRAKVNHGFHAMRKGEGKKSTRDITELGESYEDPKAIVDQIERCPPPQNECRAGEKTTSGVLETRLSPVDYRSTDFALAEKKPSSQTVIIKGGTVQKITLH
jgi:ankyrin repeat protein